MCGIGIAIPGMLDAAMRKPCQVPILPSLNNIPLCDLLEARYQLPVSLHADVDAAALGEYAYGAGQGRRRLLYLSLSAVVGASLLVDGQVEYSPQANLGHVAHLSIAAGGARCSCGKRGCINALFSFEALQKLVLRLLHNNPETSLTSLSSRLNNGEQLSLSLLAEEALHGDAVAMQCYREVGRLLGEALTRYGEICQPEVLILGGSMLNASHTILSSLQASLPSVTQRFHIAINQLGNDASLIGVAVPFFLQSIQSVQSLSVEARVE